MKTLPRWISLLLSPGCALLLGLDPSLLNEDNPDRCADGLDNDGDLLADCADDNCAAHCTCGNGVFDVGEGCDDGNNTPGDGCDASCQLEPAPGCGDGVVGPTEECDDQNVLPGDGCSPLCLLEVCGNGTLDPGERCDDGNNVDADDCEADCSLPACQNGIVDPGELCLTPLVDLIVPIARDLDVADLDQDGRAEILVAHGQSTSLVRLLADKPVAQSLPLSLDRLKIGDIDGDGLLDIVGKRFTVDELLALRHEGNFNFAEAGALALGGGILALHLADLTGNSAAEILFTRSDTLSVAALAPGTGGLDLLLEQITIGAPVSLDSADLDADGDTDLAIGSLGGSLALVTNLSNNNQLVLEQDVLPFPDNPFLVRLGQLASDPLPDLALLTEVLGLQVMLNDGPGNGISSHFADDTAFGQDLALGDLNFDGFLDVVLPTLEVFLNEAGTGFRRAAIKDLGGVRVELADVNGDDFLDVVVLSLGAGNNAVLSIFLTTP